MFFGMGLSIGFYLMDDGGNPINSIARAPSHCLTARTARLVPADVEIGICSFLFSSMIGVQDGKCGSVM